jgi:poly(A) polymerase
LFVRYSTGQGGKLIKKALIYTKAEHGINRSSLDLDALRVIERLRAHGHQAYLVGGAVRDSLVGRKPKDFDIVTDAPTGKIKKVFWNSRIIGRRFRLVHVFFDRKIIEVATFRSLKDGTVGNDYGTMDDDVRRRDFTLNALYYDPIEETIIDYCDGVRDIRRGELRPLIPLNIIFKEDPVRMIRAVKYAAASGFSIQLATRLMIKRQAKLLKEVSASRLSEEATKIFCSGKAAPIFAGLHEYRLLPFFMPVIAKRLEDRVFREGFFACLQTMDDNWDRDGENRLGRQLAFPLGFLLGGVIDWSAPPQESYTEALRRARDLLDPLTPPRVELENAVRDVYHQRGIQFTPRRRELRPARGAERA